jgi:outer membrane protein
MKNMRPLVAPAALASLLACASVQAQQNIAKVGVTYYQTRSETGGLNVDPPAAGAALAGSDVESGNATTVIFVYERRFTPNFGAEIVLGVPPEIDGNATGPLADLLQRLGQSSTVLTAKNVAPTLIFNYYFLEPESPWRPYVGAGINYTYFADIESSIPGADIDMSDSWGWAVQAGLSYAVSKQWGLFASVTRVDVKSDVTARATLTLPTPIGPQNVPVTVKTEIDFKPVTYQIGVWYAF